MSQYVLRDALGHCDGLSLRRRAPLSWRRARLYWFMGKKTETSKTLLRRPSTGAGRRRGACRRRSPAAAGRTARAGPRGRPTGSAAAAPLASAASRPGFCVTQNCTAIFVGSTLIAGALVSFMTCGICVYRCACFLSRNMAWRDLCHALPYPCTWQGTPCGRAWLAELRPGHTLHCPCCMFCKLWCCAVMGISCTLGVVHEGCAL